MSHVVVPVAADCELDSLGDLLWDAFATSLAALEGGSAVVLVVDDDALAGAATPAASALAAGALGLARALAIEGVKPGWWINVLAVPPGTPAAEVDAWLARLGEPHGASGIVLRLGTRHQARVPL